VMSYVTFKDGNRRQIKFDARLAARLIRLGHKVDPDPGLPPEQLKAETKELQREFDDIWYRERVGLPV